MEKHMIARHAAVWIDHEEAKVFHVEPENFDVSKIKAPHHHVTRKSAEQGRHAGSGRFFQEVAEALEGLEGILVVGPSSAKLDLIRHLHRHAPSIEAKIRGVETLDHPTDGQIVAYVRQYFDAEDRKHGLAP
jgi:stalled ribosome rescue protein Dom34